MDRRQLLRRFGLTAFALPAFETLHTPAANASTAVVNANRPQRLVVLNATLGFHSPHLFPTAPGSLRPVTPYLKQVADHLGEMTLFSGLSHPEQQGNNGHASSLTFLTSAQRPGLAGFRNTISLDQLIASKIGQETRFPFLALSTQGSSSLSWTSSGVSIPGQSSPAKLFKSLFVAASPSEKEKELAALRRGRSILDTVGRKAHDLQSHLSRRDKEKLGEYLDSVRDLEQRIQQTAGWIDRPKPRIEHPMPKDISDKSEAIERQRLMYKLITLALQTDSTRTITMELGGLNAVPKVPGVSSDWHGLSHHGKDPTKIDELRLIEEAEFAVFSEFLRQLKETDDSGTPLLNSTAVLFGSNLGNASAHDWRNLPIIVAGGNYKHGQYVSHSAQDNTPLANLFVALAQHTGLEIDRFGSSTAAGIKGLET